MSDILIHIDNSLDKKAQLTLENKILMQKGIFRASTSASAQHLMIVGFDNTRTSSLNILHTVKSSGYQAELIGL